MEMKYSKTEEYWRVRAKLAERVIETKSSFSKESIAVKVSLENHKEKEPEDWMGLFQVVENVRVHIKHGDAIHCDEILIPSRYLKEAK